MADFLTKRERSARMSKIRSKNNKTTEVRLANILRKKKITGWRRNYVIIGKPDFVFPNQHLAVFVDGCFWHACPKCYIRPKTNQKFWDDKRQRNKRHDREINWELKQRGWMVLRLWEHELKDENIVSKKIVRALEKRT